MGIAHVPFFGIPQLAYGSLCTRTFEYPKTSTFGFFFSVRSSRIMSRNERVARNVCRTPLTRKNAVHGQVPAANQTSAQADVISGSQSADQKASKPR